MISVVEIARVTHEANRAFCRALGDTTQPAWDEAPTWQRNSAVIGVQQIIDGTIHAPEESHEAWMAVKLKDRWVYGSVKDAVKKTHPCLVAWNRLPYEQRLKDYLFFSIVTTLIS